MSESSPEAVVPRKTERRSHYAIPEKLKSSSDSQSTRSLDNCTAEGTILDVSDKKFEFPIWHDHNDTLEELCVYRNSFNLFPKALGKFSRLKALKLFANDNEVFPPGLDNLADLEFLHVMVSNPGFSGLPLHKMGSLKELELIKPPPKSSVYSALSDISGLKSLTKLSICFFSIRYLPSQIGCLTNLQHLDLSYNKLKYLPDEIGNLSALASLKVANNRLEELPSSLSSLGNLKLLDLSSNRLTSLESLELSSMNNLQSLNLQYNKLGGSWDVPERICFASGGNFSDTSSDYSSVEMDVLESPVQYCDDNFSCNDVAYSSALSCQLRRYSTSNRVFYTRFRREKHQKTAQQLARLECLNRRRKSAGEKHVKNEGSGTASEHCKHCTIPLSANDPDSESSSPITCLNDESDKAPTTSVSVNNVGGSEEEKSERTCTSKKCLRVNGKEPIHIFRNRKIIESLGSQSRKVVDIGNAFPFDKGVKSKRHSERELENPKPCKFHRPVNAHTNFAFQYSKFSFVGVEDCLMDGFYDAGRDQPFMSLKSYERMLTLDSREVILLDREKDEGLDVIIQSASAIVSRFKNLCGSHEEQEITDDNLHVVFFLALFVSDHFGGSDRTDNLYRARKGASASNYQKPFVCTCQTGNSETLYLSSGQVSDAVGDAALNALCQRALLLSKSERKSVIVPIGSIRFGVCRHRALLMKYLCDRMDPPVPCELVRGYLDFTPHAWNVVLIKKGERKVRMIVDTCRPHDIREETDSEFFSRYVPLNRINLHPVDDCDLDAHCTSPSISLCEEIERVANSSLVRCKVGSAEAVAKVRIFEAHGVTANSIRNFEYSFLGEIRILEVLKHHPCVVKVLGHQLSSIWHPSPDGDSYRRALRSVILMEHIEGGSLKNYIDKKLKTGETSLPVDLILHIARNVACALVELHSMHIIHRDIKSENVLVDSTKLEDSKPVVKLCDFDRAVPLRSSCHTCCISHFGNPPANICVGTPRWMAPEVVRAMHEPQTYGLEVDVWSFGCLVSELLTMRSPYYGLSESDMYNMIVRGMRPPLTEKLEKLFVEDESDTASERDQSADTPSASDNIRFLVDLFRRCTEENPLDRPSVENLYEQLHRRISSAGDSASK